MTYTQLLTVIRYTAGITERNWTVIRLFADSPAVEELLEDTVAFLNPCMVVIPKDADDATVARLTHEAYWRGQGKPAPEFHGDRVDYAMVDHGMTFHVTEG